MNRATTLGENHPNLVLAIEGNTSQGNNRNRAQGRAFGLGVAEAPQDPNVVMGTFSLNDHFATVLFDYGVDYSFISTNFLPLINMKPSVISPGYEIEIASDVKVETNEIIQGCRLKLEGHTFIIGLIPFGYGSFDMIIGMDRRPVRPTARVTVFFENRPLIGLSSVENLMNRVCRLYLDNDYDCEIHYHPSKANVVADALSKKEWINPRRARAMSMTIQSSIKARILEAQSEAFKGVNSQTEMLKGLDKQFKRKEDGGFYLVERIWVPVYGNLRTLIMNEAHATRYYVHPGVDKMYYDLQGLYWWPRMKKDISMYKSYADNLRNPLEFNVGDKVLLKVSPKKGVVRFGKRSKLSTRYVGPFEIVERVGPVAYQLHLPHELLGVHDTFHVSNLKKCMADVNLHVPLEEVKIGDKLHFVENLWFSMKDMGEADVILVLEGYSGASWINHVEDSSSTSGWVFLLGGDAISWASKKQTCNTGSTMESEFVALAATGKEVEWLRNLIYKILIWPKPIALISIRCDSEPTMARAYSQIYNGKLTLRCARSKGTTYMNMKFSRFKKLGLRFLYVHQWIRTHGLKLTEIVPEVIGSLHEQNNELLMKNHKTRATGTAPFPEANVATFNNQNGGRGRGHGSDRGRGRDRGFGRDIYHGVQFKNTSGHIKWQDKCKMIKYDGGGKAKGAIENGCYRCGSINHWARVCRSPKHLVKLYQRSQKNKEKGVEINFAYQDEKIDNFDINSFGIDSLDVDPKDQNDTTHLNVSDFLTNE
uniref:Putative reverse transcriptase domain-containing protein n=1 Tax=Tanacetum cinerariifolium TaxID=118510 RepID=A0A6L2NC19_TANCI|nr:putative reverse transcriptase domain-containing protein [Tanacetum cinerariifolium]